MTRRSASTALTISDLPFLGPISAVRVGRVGGELVVNPKVSQRDDSDLDLIVAGSRNAVVMVEGGGNQIPEGEMIEALKFGHDNIVRVDATTLTLIDQVSTGAGSNPQDVVLGIDERRIRPLRQQRQLFTNLNSGDVGVDWSKRATNFFGGVRRLLIDLAREYLGRVKPKSAGVR